MDEETKENIFEDKVLATKVVKHHILKEMLCCSGITRNFMYAKTGLCNFMILRYLLSSLFPRRVLPTQAEYSLPALGEPAVKRERTTNNVKS